MRRKMFHLIQVLGIMLIILGALLFIAPKILEKASSIENIPWIILYVYRRNGLVLITSPILIIISIISIIWWIINRSGTA